MRTLPYRFQMEFEKLVRKRRMVRNFRPDPIRADLITSLLELALHAPSAGFSQGWAFVVVTEQELKKKIGELQGEVDYYASSRFHKFISEAPVLVVACASERVYHDRYREPDKLNEDGTEIEWPTPYWFFDIGCACMVIFLAAVNKGLAAAFTGVFRRPDEAASRDPKSLPPSRGPVLRLRRKGCEIPVPQAGSKARGRGYSL